MKSQTKKEELFELMKNKLPFVEQDYASYFHANSRNLDRIHQIRNVEITLISAISVVLITQKNFPVNILFFIYVLIWIFYLYNALMRGASVLSKNEVGDLEKKLQATSLTDYATNIVTWEFGNTVASKRTASLRLKAFWKTLFFARTSFMAWWIGNCNHYII